MLAGMIYDTLKLSKALRASFTPDQADTLAQAFSQSTEDTVATKLDIAELKIEIAELKTEIADLRTELKGDIASLRVEVKADLANFKVEIIRWTVGAIVFNLLGTLGIMIAVAELVLKTK